ncbi:MAG: decarboxylating 6-phosphogluconate dehydrogenase [Syntrophobacteraceae bacterium]
MDLGIVGLGRMGMGIARRALGSGHRIAALDLRSELVREISSEGARGAGSLDELVARLPYPRVIWMMLPAGDAIDETLAAFFDLLVPGDIIVDGGNSFYKDSIRRSETLSADGVSYLDVGVSGGVAGLEDGYCLMVGGPQEAFERIEPLFRAIACPEGYRYCGPAGAGHFVKMIHNAIEYAMMQAYAEGFDLLESSPLTGRLDRAGLARLWNHGSLIRSRLLECVEAAFAGDANLSGVAGRVEDTGSGRWAVQYAAESGVPAPVISLSLMERFRSRRKDALSNRLLAAVRREFGGHAVLPPENRDSGPE